MSHVFPVHVYYEDTDLAGIVYYANYLRYIERARTEWVRDLGIDQSALKAEKGVVFAVRRIAADYLLPARFDEDLSVHTDVMRSSSARLVLRQQVWRRGTVVFAAEVTLVAIHESGRPTRLPAMLINWLR